MPLLGRVRRLSRIALRVERFGQIVEPRPQPVIVPLTTFIVAVFSFLLFLLLTIFILPPAALRQRSCSIARLSALSLIYPLKARYGNLIKRPMRKARNAALGRSGETRYPDLPDTHTQTCAVFADAAHHKSGEGLCQDLGLT